MNTSKLRIPLDALFCGANYMLIEVSPYYAYQDGIKTNDLLGYKYEVVEDGDFERFNVKVPSKEPIITAQELGKSSSRLYVTFEEAYGRLYRTPTGAVEISFTAKAVQLLKP